MQKLKIKKSKASSDQPRKHAMNAFLCDGVRRWWALFGFFTVARCYHSGRLLFLGFLTTKCEDGGRNKNHAEASDYNDQVVHSNTPCPALWPFWSDAIFVGRGNRTTSKVIIADKLK